MRLFAKKTSHNVMPSKKDLENNYLLLIYWSSGSNFSWCGKLSLKSNGEVHYHAQSLLFKGNENIERRTYNGNLNFPIFKEYHVYLVDEMTFDFYKKIKTYRDLIIFFDNLKEE